MVTPIHRQVAAYARVSSEHQAQARTIESQRAAIQERIAADQSTLLPGWLFVDDGYSGETLERPGLEALRDKAAGGEIDRLYIHSPDRLARRYAYQVLLLEEFAKTGVEVVFLNHPAERSPEGELLVQVQGVIAEYERTKIMERCRRGRKQRARMGDPAVFSRAPFGYVYLDKRRHGTASFQIHPQQNQTVQLIYRWFVRDGLSLGAIVRRLNAQHLPTQSGKSPWLRSTIWAILRNPAYMGKARFNKSHRVPRTPRLHPRKGQGEHPKSPLVPRPTPPEEQIEIAVPAIVSQEEFMLAREKLESNRRRCRARASGTPHLLQGLLVCRQCGHALVHQRMARRGTREYRYYHCNGLDKQRFGGVRICQSHPIDAALLEQAVWRDLQSLLTDPERLRRQFEARLNPPPDQPPQADLAAKLLARLKQGLARLIDAYADGLLTKEEFEARSGTIRPRIKAQQEQVEQTHQQAATQAAARQACANFESFAAKIRAGVQTQDLSARLQIVRLLIKEIGISDEQIIINYKVAPNPFESAPKGGILPHCTRRLDDSTT